MSTRIRLLALVLAITGALLSVPSAVATGGHAGKAAGHQRFVALSTNAAKNGGPMVGFGAIHAKGTDKQINGHTDRFVFPQGSVLVRHKKVGGSSAFDKHNCFGTFAEHGTWRAVSGTGAYASVSGGGTYRVAAKFIGCSRHQPPNPFELQINAVGNLTV